MNEIHENKFDRLYFGKDDAERDFTSAGLLRKGFLTTSIFTAVERHHKSLVIGRKGSGKSAICLMLHETLLNHTGTLSSIISPDAISAEEIARFRLTGINDEQAKKLIWKYIFLVQISKFIVEATKREKGESDLPIDIKCIRQFLIDNGEVDDFNFQEKFWRIINKIKASVTLKAWGAEVLASAEAPNEGVSLGSKLEHLEDHLKHALNLVNAYLFHLFVDKVDEIWTNDKGSDQMVIGLLMAAKEINEKFPNVCVTTFLRADIYDMLVFHDRDKLRGDEAHIRWTEEELENLILARANASTDAHMTANQFWYNFFPREIDGVQTYRYMIERTLKRPRDIIQMCNLCADNARIKGESSIGQDIIKNALEVYSNWKLQDLIAEYRFNFPFLNDLLIIFSNTSYVLKRSRIHASFSAIEQGLKDRYPEYKGAFTFDAILNVLYSIAFLGVERNETPVYYYDAPRTVENKDQTFIVHPAFRNALKLELGINPDVFFNDQDLVSERQRASAEFARGRSVVRGHFENPRGWYRDAEEMLFMLEQLYKAMQREDLPTEVAREIDRGMRGVLDKLRYSLKMGLEDFGDVGGLRWALRKYIATMNKRLTEHELLRPNSEASDLMRRLSEIP